jgi:hypothetical protein
MGRNTAYRPSTLGIIVVTMNAEDGNGNIEIWVFVVNGWEAESHNHSFREIKKNRMYLYPSARPSSGLLRSSS